MKVVYPSYYEQYRDESFCAREASHCPVIRIGDKLDLSTPNTPFYLFDTGLVTFGKYTLDLLDMMLYNQEIVYDDFEPKTNFITQLASTIDELCVEPYVDHLDKVLYTNLCGMFFAQDEDLGTLITFNPAEAAGIVNHVMRYNSREQACRTAEYYETANIPGINPTIPRHDISFPVMYALIASATKYSPVIIKRYQAVEDVDDDDTMLIKVVLK